MSLTATLLLDFLSRPEIQATVAGLIVKVVTDQAKPFLKKVDASGLEDQYKVPIHGALVVFSTLVTAANLALNHRLSSLDLTSTITLVVNSLMAYFMANGLHQGGKAALKATLGRETLKK